MKCAGYQASSARSATEFNKSFNATPLPLRGLAEREITLPVSDLYSFIFSAFFSLSNQQSTAINRREISRGKSAGNFISPASLRVASRGANENEQELIRLRRFLPAARTTLDPGWFNFACGSNYPHQAPKGGYFVFLWRVGT